MIFGFWKKNLFLLFVVFAVALTADAKNSSEALEVHGLLRHIHFSTSHIERQVNGFEEQSPSGLVQETYIYQSEKNEVIWQIISLPGFGDRYSFPLGIPQSTLLSRLRFAFQVKNIFDLSYELSSVEKKLESTFVEKKLGSDYLTEMADLLQKVNQIESSNYYISDNFHEALSLSTLKGKLIHRIRLAVFMAHKNKSRAVAASFWKRLAQNNTMKTLMPFYSEFNSFLNINPSEAQQAIFWNQMIEPLPSRYSSISLAISSELACSSVFIAK